MWACPNSDDNNTSTRHIWVCLLGDGAHPWQLAQSSSSTDTSSKAVRMLRVMIKISCPLPSHDATPVEAAVPDPTTPASGPHHTPLSTGAMAHHTVGEEDIGLVPAGETREKQNFFCRCEITITFKPKQNYLFFTVLPGMTYIVDFFMFLNVKKNLCSVFFFKLFSRYWEIAVGWGGATFTEGYSQPNRASCALFVRKTYWEENLNSAATLKLYHGNLKANHARQTITVYKHLMNLSNPGWLECRQKQK